MPSGNGAGKTAITDQTRQVIALEKSLESQKEINEEFELEITTLAEENAKLQEEKTALSVELKEAYSQIEVLTELLKSEQKKHQETQPKPVGGQSSGNTDETRTENETLEAQLDETQMALQLALDKIKRLDGAEEELVIVKIDCENKDKELKELEVENMACLDENLALKEKVEVLENALEQLTSQAEDKIKQLQEERFERADAPKQTVSLADEASPLLLQAELRSVQIKNSTLKAALDNERVQNVELKAKLKTVNTSKIKELEKELAEAKETNREYAAKVKVVSAELQEMAKKDKRLSELAGQMQETQEFYLKRIGNIQVPRGARIIGKKSGNFSHLQPSKVQAYKTKSLNDAFGQ